jgi:AAA+ ATPase superfamily predicted ATPase
MKNYNFPLGLAQGEYFCNRVSETEKLVRNIESCTHTVLISPRRYGKTSLAYRAIKQSKLPYAKIDLYMSTSPKDIEKAIVKGVNSIISQITGVSEKILQGIKGYVKSLKPTLEAGSSGFKLILETKDNTNPPETICEALQILDQILTKKSERCVLLIDEFQEVKRVASNSGIEGAIRHIAQETKHFSIIFSGSKRNLLKSIFNDRNKPLYRLCDEIVLQRIEEKDYHGFVQKFSKEKWGAPLHPDIFQRIMDLTERHSYYFNALLRLVFESNTLPTLTLVDNLWEDLAERKRNDLLSETSSLTMTQRKLLIAISHGRNQTMTGKDFLNEEKLASASVVKGLEYLCEEDFIEKIDGKYELIDPLLKMVIKKLS